MRPLISICLPTYNRATYLPGAIKSIQASTYKEWELIIIDDGSTDSTPKLMEYYTKNDKRVKYFYRAENKGISVTRNEAISHAEGDYIAVADSDDIYYKSRLDIAMKTLLKTGADVFYSSYLRANDRGEIIDGVMPAKHFSFKGTKVDEILATQIVPHVTIVARKKCFLDNSYRDELKVNDDMALVLQWWKADYKFCMSSKPLVMVRFHNQSTSVTKDKEVKAITEKLRKEFA